MRWPGVLPANESRGFASLLDVTASILMAAGVTPPRTYQGMDLITPISEGKPSPRTAAAATEFLSFAIVTKVFELFAYVWK